MFTGIVEEVGVVLASDDGARLRISGPLAASDAGHGDSIAVSGVCLTVTELPGDGSFAVDVMPETLRRTALGGLRPGDRVNLERSLRADTRLGGHVVQGHVDGVGTVLARDPGERWDTVRIGLDRDLARFVAEKGAITVSGVSLTVTAVGDDWFEVGLIPTTLAETTLGELAVGAPVNLEVDVLAKYVARLLETGDRR
ncbi:riboflavin synthase [Cellulomonas denverensis]|uniref:Riboflavin synthase n=1 Tax=Cellulomonas denverensis TaxID=264297 RepID=A0A7X6KTP3_9CELL|nr:riboflavin synthase [Cellulomonas denverensis]NKY21900.1 riboflavin synthase [Cellulomonas denverensis]GIG24210.1 riboflavin synthase subunit alpha [Cellulomonas denverensis]